MPQMPRRLRLAVALFAAITTISACSSSSDEPRDSTAVSADDPNDASSGGIPDVGSDRWDLKVADVEGYLRALERQRDSVREGSKRVKAMPNGPKKDTAYVRVATGHLTYSGAMVQASGMSADRFMEVASHLEDGYNALTGGADSATAQIILSNITPDVRATLERSIPRIKAVREQIDRDVMASVGMDSLPTAADLMRPRSGRP